MSKHPEELFVALLRSAYGNACHFKNGMVGRRPTMIQTACRLPRILATSRCLSICSIGPGKELSGRREYATKAGTSQQQIAVLGGGITGLTAAHYLARHMPNTHITIYDATDRLGGWIDGVNVDAKPGQVLVQRGPRMLRASPGTAKYDDLVLYDVLANLGLQDKIRSPNTAANDRYIYYPDHLVKLPGVPKSVGNAISMAVSLLTEPLYKGGLSSMWHSHKYANGKPRPFLTQPKQPWDESAGDLLRRVYGPGTPFENILSAVYHGIHAGDVNKLSAKHTVLSGLWSSLYRPPFEGHEWVAMKDLCLQQTLLDGPNGPRIVEMAENAIREGLMTFEDGLLTLVDGLKADLQTRANVTIKYKTPVTSLTLAQHGVKVSSGDHQVQYSKVLSTLFSGQLARVALPANCLPSLAETQAVSIMVVNLWYPNSKLLDKYAGFGYLIPQSVQKEQNQECALGVLFDSHVARGTGERPGTKLTVMLGGHYWDDWPMLPSAEMGEMMARAVVERHLGISAEEPVVVSSKLCKECIPQHTVGHTERMAKAHEELLRAFQGKLMVSGPSYTAVGVIPAMRAGFDAAMRMAKGSPPWVLDEQGNNSKPGFWSMLEPDLTRYIEDSNNVMDHMGSTGLKWATEKELDLVGLMNKRAMRLRKWTPRDRRFLDEKGQWKEDGAGK